MCIHRFLDELGVDEVRQRGAVDDKPLRMVKTLVHELCKCLVRLISDMLATPLRLGAMLVCFPPGVLGGVGGGGGEQANKPLRMVKTLVHELYKCLVRLCLEILRSVGLTLS